MKKFFEIYLKSIPHLILVSSGLMIFALIARHFGHERLAAGFISIGFPLIMCVALTIIASPLLGYSIPFLANPEKESSYGENI